MGNIQGKGCDPIAAITCDMFTCFNESLVDTVRDAVAARYMGPNYALEGSYMRFMNHQPRNPVVLLPGFMGNELMVIQLSRKPLRAGACDFGGPDLLCAGDSIRGGA